MGHQDSMRGLGDDAMQHLAEVRTIDQQRALWTSTVAFTVCFAVWTIFSIIGVQIKKDLGLNDTQFGLLVGTPILTGSLIRLMLGIWTDHCRHDALPHGCLSRAVTWIEEAQPCPAIRLHEPRHPRSSAA